MEEEYSREKHLELRDLAREAFRKSIGIKDGEAMDFNHRDYSTLDMAFLWWFKKLVEDNERELCARLCDEVPMGSSRNDCAAAIRARGEK